MIFYAKLYHFYQSTLVKTIRIFVLFFLTAAVVQMISQGVNAFIPLGLLNLFVVWEIFVYGKIGHMMPEKNVSEVSEKNVLEALSRNALLADVGNTTTRQMIRELLSYQHVKFILHKAGIPHTSLHVEEVSKESLHSTAWELAKALKGTYITSMDILVAYLLLTEEKTKLLFEKKLKKDDILHILAWARIDYPNEEKPHKIRVHMTQEGIGEALVSGWTLETKKYTRYFGTVFQKRPLLIGREKEYAQLLEALEKTENNNVLLLGEQGVGKETLIEALAYDSSSGELSPKLNYKRIFELLISRFVAGAGSQSELEERLQAIIDEISHSGNVIIYIPEFQHVLGSSSFGIDLSGALLPYLKGGKIPIIASLTMGNYKAYMEKNSIKEVFSPFHLDEPDKDTALRMVFEKAGEIEARNSVYISYLAVKAAVQFADRFRPDDVLPGSAIQLLDNAANRLGLKKDIKGERILTDEEVVEKVEEEVHVAIAAPKNDEKELLLHLEEKLHERVIRQDAAIKAISEAMRRLRTGMSSSSKPISFLFLGPTGVGKTETARALASLYYGGEKEIIRLDMSEYADEVGMRRLLGAPPGSGSERGELTEKVHDNPSTLILLDEFEKAHPIILNLFLQVLEDGRLTDNQGKTVSFRNCIIIATSNAGSQMIAHAVQNGQAFDKTFHDTLLRYLQEQNLFKPELLNRFDDVIIFQPLGMEEGKQIARLLLNQLVKKLTEEDITFSYDEKVLEKVVNEGMNTEYGARPLRRYIQSTIEDMIAEKKLKGELQRGNSLALTLDAQNNFTAKK